MPTKLVIWSITLQRISLLLFTFLEDEEKQLLKRVPHFPTDLFSYFNYEKLSSHALDLHGACVIQISSASEIDFNVFY